MVNGLLLNHQELSKTQAQALGPAYGDSESVFFGSTFFIKGNKYLPWMMKMIRKHGGLILKQKVENLAELTSYDIVINCTGLGARELVQDDKVFPTRGQIVVVQAPKVEHFCFFCEKHGSMERLYVLLHKDHVVLGGTLESHNWSTVPDPVTTQDILRRCRLAEPGLKEADIIGGWACLRPTRVSGVRLEVENPETHPVIIHNYGHGSNGVILSWGCALETCMLVEQCFSTKATVPLRMMSKL